MQGGQEVVGRPLNGEHLDARAGDGPARNEAEKPSGGVAVGGQPGVPGVDDHGDAGLVDPGPERVEHVGGRRERAAGRDRRGRPHARRPRASWSSAHSSSRTASSTSASVM